MTRGIRMTVTAAAGVAVLAACSGPPPDVTESAGQPASPPAATAPATSGDSVATAPACRGFPNPAAAGLPCLGPGPGVDVHTLPGPTVVSVWASWCQPCRDELPVLQQFADAGGSVLGIDVADRPQAAADLLADLDVTIPSVQDPGSATRVDLGWVGPPANYVIVNGAVVYRFDRPVTSVEQLRRAVRQAAGG